MRACGMRLRTRRQQRRQRSCEHVGSCIDFDYERHERIGSRYQRECEHRE